MVDERESPSAGWREVHDEMEAAAGVEEATHPCPDCGRTCENVLRDVYECDEHGVFRASASGGDGESSSDGEDGTPDADESEELKNPTRGSAD